ncbi:LLM class flavin-dependent oxidoreductase [[Mycobacterium] vasticus]|uniref:LLM class flavin-dependent oxidoreductase n=1 Tax=[Mycobacterium] vasticus TaxID=2875777 RepID=A0ABU5Z2S9_9MYCO|nr:LLM class flavin-dependent oxidoreductase [Mycolicibacter sp. MYC017]MEB3071673.1 LLM class flavin-dependent oxidoreductase [Mycolicibacter sp. MYC017]
MVKVGVYGQFIPPLDQAVTYTKTCEDIGFDAVAFTDQISANHPNSAWPELPVAAAWGKQHKFLDASIVMALSAAATERVELYLGAIDVVRHAPSKLAQHFMTLDHAARGRAFFALGASEAKNVLMYGHKRYGSAKKLEDSLAIIRKMFDSHGEPVWYEGEQYSMKGGVFELEPYGSKPPKVLAATGGSPDTLDLVGRYGDGLLTNLPGMCLGGPEQFARDVQLVRMGAERAGRDPDELVFAASVLTLMSEDEDEIQRLASSATLRWNTIVYGAVRGAEWKQFGYTHPLGDDWGYAKNMVPERMSRDEFFAAAEAVPVEAVRSVGHFTGTPEVVAEKLAPYIDAGLNYAFLVEHSPLADPSTATVATANIARLTEIIRGGRGLATAGASVGGYLGVGDS